MRKDPEYIYIYIAYYTTNIIFSVFLCNLATETVRHIFAIEFS